MVKTTRRGETVPPGVRRTAGAVTLVLLMLASVSCQQVQSMHLSGLNPLYRSPDEDPVTFPPGVNPPAETTPVEQQPVVTPDLAEKRFGELLKAAADKVAAARDFHCVLVRREVVDGELKPEETLDFTQRLEPHALRLEWIGKVYKGRKMAYVKGANDNKVLVRLGGITGRLKVWRFAPHSDMIKAYSRYTPDVAGYNNLIERMVRVHKTARSAGTLAVTMSEPGIRSGRNVQRFGLTFSGLTDVDASGMTVWFDLDSSLPVHTIMRDVSGRMVEDYDWRHIELDRGLAADDFKI